MNKQEEFLYIVQTVMLANSINLSTLGEDKINQYRHVISATGAYTFSTEAIRVSKKIPERMSAENAANEFISYFLDNLKESENNLSCPVWCQR